MNADLWFLLQSCRQIRALDLQVCENLHSNGMNALAEDNVFHRFLSVLLAD